MFFLSLLLHIYQPPPQYPAITKKITQSSYRLLLKILEKTRAKITLNIPASLTEQLANLGGEDVIKGIKDLTEKGQIELTGTAAYHPILPKLPEDLIKSQIVLNSQINQKYFGKIYRPDGFFPPEMAFNSKVGRVLESMGFDWVILDEFGYKRELGMMKRNVIYVKKPLSIFFRNNRLSIAVAMSQVKTLKEFLRLLHSGKDPSKVEEFKILALDGETFGHHQPGQDKLLLDILSYKKFKIVTISELKKYFRKQVPIVPLISSWGVTLEDLRKKIYWPKWDYPGNPIHKLQWQLTKLVLSSRPTSNFQFPTSVFNRSLHSDQYFWASHRPYWHPEMVERGAKMLLDTVLLNPKASSPTKKQAQKLYNEIVMLGKKLYGDEIIT